MNNSDISGILAILSSNEDFKKHWQNIILIKSGQIRERILDGKSKICSYVQELALVWSEKSISLVKDTEKMRKKARDINLTHWDERQVPLRPT